MMRNNIARLWGYEGVCLGFPTLADFELNFFSRVVLFIFHMRMREFTYLVIYTNEFLTNLIIKKIVLAHTALIDKPIIPPHTPTSV
jgi:hypothetical protein